MKETDNKEKIEQYNLMNKECQTKFKEYTSNTKMLSSVFNSDDDVEYLTQRLLKKIDGCIAKSFKKIRITNKTRDKTDKLYDKLRELIGQTDEDNKKELKDMIELIAQQEEDNFNKLKMETENIEPGIGGMNPQKMWQMRKKSCDPPSVMQTKEGILLTTDKEIEDEATKEFTERLDNSEIKEHLKQLEEEKNELCDLRLKLTKMKKTVPWNLEELNVVLKQIKTEDQETLTVMHMNYLKNPLLAMICCKQCSI